MECLQAAQRRQPVRRRIRVRGQQREPDLELARTLLQVAREARQQAAKIKPRKGKARNGTAESGSN
jgi:hypothetical protein